jgi:hypothetical protein
MTYVLVDTNVAVVANGGHQQAGIGCVRKCVLRLMNIKEGSKIVLDSCGLILKEYLKHNPHGMPRGAGDVFMVWASDNQANPNVCLRATVTPRHGTAVSRDRNDLDPDLEEFPNDPALATFDRQDRKFVAAALSSGVNPVIVNATDRDWANHHDQLAAHGVVVEHICSSVMG